MRRTQGHGGLWVAGQLLLFAAYALCLRTFESIWEPGSGVAARVVGLGLTYLGAAWLAWAVYALRRSFSVLPEPSASNSLVTDGPYRLVRHPIYTGVFLGLTGWAVFRGVPAALVVAIVLTLYLLAKSKSEERRLVERHPLYRSYQEQTRWRILPGL